MITRKLTARQRAFVDAYALSRNATQAAIEAGYAESTAKHQAGRLLWNVGIQAAIAKVQNREHGHAVATYDEACEKLTAIARGNVGDYLDDGGCINIEQIRTRYPEAVQSVEQKTFQDDSGNTTIVTKFRLHDSIRAIERLAKLKGWDQPTRSIVEANVTTGPDLSKLSDKELATMESLLEKAAE